MESPSAMLRKRISTEFQSRRQQRTSPLRRLHRLRPMRKIWTASQSIRLRSIEGALLEAMLRGRGGGLAMPATPPRCSHCHGALQRRRAAALEMLRSGRRPRQRNLRMPSDGAAGGGSERTGTPIRRQHRLRDRHLAPRSGRQSNGRRWIGCQHCRRHRDILLLVAMPMGAKPTASGRGAGVERKSTTTMPGVVGRGVDGDRGVGGGGGGVRRPSCKARTKVAIAAENRPVHW